MLLEVLDVFERHGMHHRDDQHTGAAIGLLRDVALIYDGQQPSCASVIGAVLNEERTQLLAEMCRDALARLATDVETGRECGCLNGEICSWHACALTRAEGYRSLAFYLGAPVM